MSTQQNIHSKLEEGLFWAPRLLASIGILIMLLFSYEPLWDTFNLTGWELILYSHIIPAVLITVLLYIAWRHEMTGAIGFILLSAISLIALQAGNNRIAAMFIAFPLLLIGVLFLIHSSEYDLSIRSKRNQTRS